MTFNAALNNPKAKELIELIEEVESDMDYYPNGNATLEGMKANWVNELSALGYNWK